MKIINWNKKYISIPLLICILIALNIIQVFGISEQTLEAVDSVISLPAEAVKGQVRIGLQGRTYTNVFGKGNIQTTLTSDDTGTGILPLNDGSFGLYNNENRKVVSLIPGNKYYIAIEVNPSSTGDLRNLGFVYYDQNNYNKSYRYDFGEGTSQKEKDVSFIFTADPSITDQTQCNVMIAEGDEGDIIVKSMLLIDLTTTFGSGNEPTKEWCNQNLQYITETKSTVLAQRIKSRNDKKNLLDKSTVKRGYLVSQATGKSILNSSFAHSDWIYVKPNTQYSKNNDAQLSFYREKKEDSYIGFNIATRVTTPNNCYYARWSMNNTEFIDTAMLVEGDILPDEYVDYEDSTSYYYGEDEKGNTIEFNSLPNGVKDKVNEDGKFIKRSGSLDIRNITDWILNDEKTNTIRISKQLNELSIDNYNNGIGDAVLYLDGLKLIDTNSSLIDRELLLIDDTYLKFRLDKSKLSSLDSAGIEQYLQSLNQTLINYQLDEEKIYKLNIQPFISYKTGTIYIEPAVKSIGIADINEEIWIDNINLPIKELESIYKVEGKTMIPVENYTVATDGLSISVQGAKSGDIYEYVYFYDESLTTTPEIEISVSVDSAQQIDGILDMDKKQSEVIDFLLERIDTLEREIKELREGKAIYYDYDDNGSLKNTKKY